MAIYQRLAIDLCVPVSSVFASDSRYRAQLKDVPHFKQLDSLTKMMLFVIGAVVFCVLVLLYARYIEPNLLVVRKVSIHHTSSTNGTPPLRITLISDIHYPRCSTPHLIRRAIEKSNAFDPDYVFLLGDFFDKRRRDPAILPADIRTVFGNIRSRSGVYGVLGNHDHWFDAPAIRSALASDTDIRLIDNASVCIGDSESALYLVGIGDLHTGNAHYPEAVQGLPENAQIILLSHNPDVVEDIHDPRILVQFSGHTHGGQVRFPFVGALRVPSRFGNRYSQGWSTQGNHPLYVTRGICSMKNIRFLCPPEVTWVEIHGLTKTDQ